MIDLGGLKFAGTIKPKKEGDKLKLGIDISLSGEVALPAFGSVENDLLITVNCPSASYLTHTLNCVNVGTFDATIDWGDGSPVQTITSYNDPNLTHTFPSAGVDYQIRISGILPGMLNFNGAGSATRPILRSVDNLGSTGLQRMDSCFRSCDNLTSFTPGDCDTSQLTDMGYTFNDCGGLTGTLDLSAMDFSSLETMDFCFRVSAISEIIFPSGGLPAANNTCFRAAFLQMPNLTSLDFSFAAPFNPASTVSLLDALASCPNLTEVDLSGLDRPIANLDSAFLNCPALVSLPDVGNWDIEICGSFVSAFGGTTALPTAVYDELLIGWAAQNALNNKTADFGGSKYTGGGAAAAARASLIADDTWTINDGGIAP